MKNNYIPTGNQMLSLPQINERNAAIEDFTFLHMGFKGLVDVRGTEEMPLMLPTVAINGTAVEITELKWTRLSYWIPQFCGKAGGLVVTGTILTPVDERGFMLRLELCNETSAGCTVQYGLTGCWGSAWHCVNEDKELEGSKHCYNSAWNDSIIFDMRCGAPLFCFAPMTDRHCTSTYQLTDGQVDYSILCSDTVQAGESCVLTIAWGIGFEEVAAATSAKELLRQGFDCELQATVDWLEQRIAILETPKLTELYNTNLFFCIFFSTGITIDTEELVLVTSRSPRYYVSAAYWDRDSLLWSFPAILDADHELARQMLEYVFGRQCRNIGVHSRFIDGTVLEPGFELDELMAPVIALERYIDRTNDTAILSRQGVLCGIEDILKKLQKRRHTSVELYSTFLQPTDDEHVYPYLTYDNVLVWKGLRAIARLMPQYSNLNKLASKVRAAIEEHCVQTVGGKQYYGWSIDLAGQHDVYDEPPGSLQLLPWLGYCAETDEVYRNTVDMIRSPKYEYSFAGCSIAEIGCPHAAHPWILSVANSLLCGRREHCKSILERVTMDNMIACESVDEHTGECTTGEAFATCAGFLCHSMRHAFGGSHEE